MPDCEQKHSFPSVRQRNNTETHKDKKYTEGNDSIRSIGHKNAKRKRSKIVTIRSFARADTRSYYQITEHAITVLNIVIRGRAHIT